MKKVYIVLEDGHIFEGKSFGAEGEALGELVFTTSVVGYVAALTDPRYYGQIILQTFPLIGNYGYISAQRESNKVWAKAYIVREWCENPSNFRCETTLDEYLKRQGVVGVYDVDTREITQLIRENGVMNAKIVSSLDDIDYEEIKNYNEVWLELISSDITQRETLRGTYKVQSNFVEDERGIRFFFSSYGATWLAYELD